MISEFLEDVVIAGDEKKAPPYMERLQKEHCIVGEEHTVYLFSFSSLSWHASAHHALVLRSSHHQH